MIRRAMIFPLVFLFYASGSCESADDKMKLVRFGNCPDEKNLAMFVPDLHITQVNKATTIANGYVDVRENMTERSLTGRISIKLCQDMRNLDKCITFIEDLKDRDICEALDSGFLTKNKLMQAMKPKMRCPLRATRHQIHDAVVADGYDIPAMKSNSKMNFVHTRAIFLYKKRRVLCLDVWAQMGGPKRARKINRQ